jgi:hypothetical protein
LVAQLNAFYSTSTNSRDVACAYNGENYVIFDLTRENSEQINIDYNSKKDVIDDFHHKKEKPQTFANYALVFIVMGLFGK